MRRDDDHAGIGGPMILDFSVWESNNHFIVPASPPEASAVVRQSSRFVSLAVNTSCRKPAKYHRARITGVVDKTETLYVFLRLFLVLVFVLTFKGD